MSADFRPLADLLPQPLLLVTSAGLVTAVNRAAAALLGRSVADLENRPLGQFCATDETAIAALLRAGARSTSPSPAALQILLADGRALACRCEGALFRLGSDDTPALVLLRLVPKQEAIAHFSVLNQRIDRLSREISLRRETEEKLRESTGRLEQADRRKDEFLSMLAHELRNPLAPLTMGVLLLDRKHGALPEVARLTGMMARQTRHMARLIDDLLDVSRLTRGKIELRQDPVLLSEAVEQAVEMERPALAARGLTLDVAPATGQPLVRGDLTRLVQVFANLLANAAKFTDSGGQVAVRTWDEGDEVVVSVRDTGMGIPADLLNQVFDLFVQGERTLDRTQGGLGVGLTIVRSIVQQHGGSVQVSSPGRGAGSEFQVRLPLLAPPAAAAPPAASAPEPEPAAPAGSLRVLVVDDNIDAAETLSSLVQSWGHQVEVVHGGAAALARMPVLVPHALLLDIGLPGMNGYELARALRQLPHADSLLLVAVTGYGDAEARRRSALAGYDQHLTKPVDPDTLERILAEHGLRQGAARPQ